MKGRLYLILAILAGTAAGLLAYGYISSLDQRVPVVVASRDLPQGATIEASDIRLRPLHPSAVHHQAITDLGDAAGRNVLLPILSGEQLVSTKLADPGIKAYIAALPPDSRALLAPLPLSRSLGGLVSPGDFVDVVFVSDPMKLDYSFSRTILKGLLVLDVRSDRGSSVGASDQGGFLGAILSVTPQEAEILAYALSNGHIFLVGRNPLAHDGPTRGAGLEDLLGLGGTEP